MAGRYNPGAMTHVFVSPHPDDAALSCGGLIASLRELGQNVAILTVYSGNGSAENLTPYQREALGFGSKALWPVTEAFNRANIPNDVGAADEPLPPWAATADRLDATQADADAAAKRFWQRSSWYRRASIHNESLAGQPVIDQLSTQGAVLTVELTEAEAAADATATRRLEDERYAYFAEASLIVLDLPDAVFRGYDGDAELLGTPRDDDPAPVALLRTEIARLEPQKVYFPLGVGGHVDHQLVRNVGLAMIGDARRWVMPGPEWAGIVTFYEDFPYAWWNDFRSIDQLGDGLRELPYDVSIVPEYADISDQLERKINGLTIYESQLPRLFGGTREMADAVRGYGRKIGALGGLTGHAERYWSSLSL
jgi:LmbE family N-acetylglucosaminyl deacetylase